LALQAGIPTDLAGTEWDDLSSDVQAKIRDAGYVTSYESKANENEGWWECENCSAIAIKDEDRNEHEQKTGHTMYHAGFKPVVPLFHEAKASEAKIPSGDLYQYGSKVGTIRDYNPKQHEGFVTLDGIGIEEFGAMTSDFEVRVNGERIPNKWDGKHDYNLDLFGESRATDLKKEIKKLTNYINMASFENPLNMGGFQDELDGLKSELASLGESKKEEPINKAIENILNEADFKEDEHPREDSGKFTSGGSKDTGKMLSDLGDKVVSDYKAKYGHTNTSTKDLIKSIKGGSKEWKDWGRNEKTEDAYAEIERRNKEIPRPKRPEGSASGTIFRDDPDAVSKMEKKVKYLEDIQDYWKKVTKFPNRPIRRC